MQFHCLTVPKLEREYWVFQHAFAFVYDWAKVFYYPKQIFSRKGDLKWTRTRIVETTGK